MDFLSLSLSLCYSIWRPIKVISQYWLQRHFCPLDSAFSDVYCLTNVPVCIWVLQAEKAGSGGAHKMISILRNGPHHRNVCGLLPYDHRTLGGLFFPFYPAVKGHGCHKSVFWLNISHLYSGTNLFCKVKPRKQHRQSFSPTCKKDQCLQT